MMKVIVGMVVGFIVSQLLFLYFNLIAGDGTLIFGTVDAVFGSVLIAVVGIGLGAILGVEYARQ